MSVALLDLNVLIALLDRRHVHHEAALAGLRQVRRMAGPPSRSHRTRCCASSASLLDQNGVDPSRLLEATQLTDTVLLALAVHRGGRLVSFDRRIGCEGVAGSGAALWLIDA